MRWGSAPELVGPRHRFRVALMARVFAAYLPPDQRGRAAVSDGSNAAASGPAPAVAGSTGRAAAPAEAMAGGRGTAPALRSPAVRAVPRGMDAGAGSPAAHAIPRVLDAGAGRGTLARLLAHRGYAVTALEESPDFLHFLQAQLFSGPVDSRVRGARVGPGAGIGRLPVDLVRGDVMTLPFGAAAFDGAVCGEVLEHVPDDAAVVGELARVLRPGAVVVATVPAGRARYGWLDRWAGHARRYELPELRDLVTRHGFKVRRLHHWGFPFGLLYERLIQRPVLARHVRAGATAPLAMRLGHARLVGQLAAALFCLDQAGDGTRWGPSLLLVAERA